MAAIHENLPYVLPDNNRDIIIRLGEILEINPHQVENVLLGHIEEQLLIEVMSGVLMYNFLDQKQQGQVKEKFLEIEKGGRRDIFIRRLAATEKKRGAWSLTADELDKMTALRKKVHTFGDISGLSLNVTGFGEAANQIYKLATGKTASIPPVRAAYILVSFSMWGFFLQNDRELKRLETEIKNRSRRLDSELSQR